MEEPFRTKEPCARDRRDVVRIGFQRSFSSIDRCPPEIPRLVAPLVALARPREGETAHLVPRDLIAPHHATEQLVLSDPSRGSARRAAVTTAERRATVRNDESIARRLTRAARRVRLEPMDATRRRTEGLLVNDRLAATTAMTSTLEELEATRLDAHAQLAPVAMAGRHDHRDLTIATTATRADRALSARRDPVRARTLRRARLAAMTATATRGHPGRARSLRTDVPLVPSVAMTATLAIAVRVSPLVARGPIHETARVMRGPVVRPVVEPIDVPAN